MSFRDFTPKRRPIIKYVSKYTQHRDDLKIDFKDRCGYCNDIYIWRFASFEIDHFIPRKKDKKNFLTIKTETDYSNLVYACRSCNNSKSNKWPTNDQSIPHRNDQGFVDPCEDDYNNHFTRLDNGQIKPTTNLGEWIYNNLKFHKPQHEVIWNIEQLDGLIKESKLLLNNISDDSLAKVTKDLLLNLYDKYLIYTKQLGEL
ncbi:HNH endonuclease [Elizabethkingia anophelis]|nr:HNH endonuclease [Elizabethkingia anophelis]